MSTNIKIDVTKNALQDLLEQTRAENLKDKQEREDESELEQSKQRGQNQQEQARSAPSQLDDPSNVPELYKKDEPAASLFQAGPNICYAWEAAAGRFIYTANGSVYERAIQPSLNEQLNSTWFWNLDELNDDDQNNGTAVVDGLLTVYDGDTIVSVITDNTVSIGNFSASADLGTFTFDAQSLNRYDKGIDGRSRGDQLVLPVDSETFILASSVSFEAVAYQLAQRIAPDGFASFVWSTLNLSGTRQECLLISSSAVKPIPLPGRLATAIEQIVPFPQIDRQTFQVGLSGYPTLVVGGLQVYQQVEVPGGFVVFDADLLNGLADDPRLYAHYISGGTPRTASPAMLWYLNNYSPSITNRPIDALSDEEIRASYDANYGLNPTDSWYSPVPYITGGFGFPLNSPDTTRDGAFVQFYAGPDSSSLFNPFSIEGVEPVRMTNSFATASAPSSLFNSGGIPLVAWDGGVPDYCREQLLQLGFSDSDLRF